MTKEKDDTREELLRLREEQIRIRAAKEEQQQMINSNLARMEVLRQRRYITLRHVLKEQNRLNDFLLPFPESTPKRD